MPRPKLFEGRSISVRLSEEDEALFQAEKDRRRGISDSALARELIDEALRARTQRSP
jgi:hypothetical protein